VIAILIWWDRVFLTVRGC
jgi:hypothetical protein